MDLRGQRKGSWGGGEGSGCSKGEKMYYKAKNSGRAPFLNSFQALAAASCWLLGTFIPFLLPSVQARNSNTKEAH